MSLPDTRNNSRLAQIHPLPNPNLPSSSSFAIPPHVREETSPSSPSSHFPAISRIPGLAYGRLSPSSSFLFHRTVLQLLLILNLSTTSRSPRLDAARSRSSSCCRRGAATGRPLAAAAWTEEGGSCCRLASCNLQCCTAHSCSSCCLIASCSYCYRYCIRRDRDVLPFAKL